MHPHFLERLDTLRLAYGRPLLLTSAYRCPDHNARVAATGRAGPHTTGRAVDVRVGGVHAVMLLHLALGLGFSGIGVYQQGEMGSRFLHLDDLTATVGQPRPWVWSTDVCTIYTPAVSVVAAL
jgi:uncharacterized protein YcbK (DUF882 family)